MATSSIKNDIQITDKKEAEEMVEAMERAAMFGKKKNNTGAGVQNNGDGR